MSASRQQFLHIASSFFMSFTVCWCSLKNLQVTVDQTDSTEMLSPIFNYFQIKFNDPLIFAISAVCIKKIDVAKIRSLSRRVRPLSRLFSCIFLTPALPTFVQIIMTPFGEGGREVAKWQMGSKLKLHGWIAITKYSLILSKYIFEFSKSLRFQVYFVLY